jgi:hypothetical protein
MPTMSIINYVSGQGQNVFGTKSLERTNLPSPKAPLIGSFLQLAYGHPEYYELHKY